MLMALYTGMRKGILFKLKWHDINFGREFISIVDPKGGSDQRIPLLTAKIRLMGCSGLVQVGQENKKPSEEPSNPQAAFFRIFNLS